MVARPQTTGYKFLTAEMESKNGDCGKWVLGEWKRHEGPLEMCHSGFHYCKEPLDAFEYVAYGDILTVVEARGDEITEGDKTVAREMRVVKVLDTKRVAVRFAVACARRSLPRYEKDYPGDKRVRAAVEAAEAYLKDPSKANRSAAWSAARRSWSAALSRAKCDKSVIWYAESAARCAQSASMSAPWSAAWAAAKSAECASWSFSRSADRSAERQWQNMTLKSFIEEEYS